MIKFMLGVVIVAFSSLCGYILAKKYRQRKEFFFQFYEFNERFLSEITYYRRPLKDFIGNYTYKNEFKEVLEDFIVYSEEQKTEEGALFLQESLYLSRYSFLKTDERQALTDYFFMLGKGDSHSQKSYFSSVKEYLKKQRDETETVCKKYGNLYVEMGFLCGLLLLILII